jgi:hypothetical protein
LPSLDGHGSKSFHPGVVKQVWDKGAHKRTRIRRRRRSAILV